MIQTASILWKTDQQGNSVPTSLAFDDVYFSHASGIDESFYVFCQHNHLPARFEQLFKDNQPTSFVVAETGFGTGLNFLVCVHLWLSIAKAYPSHTLPRLHFISTEKYPLSHTDLAQALKAWQGRDDELDSLIDDLLASYPLPLMGCHRLNFGLSTPLNIVLDLWIGDAYQSFDKLCQHTPTPQVDAWFLDGFAPSKNSELWSDDLFNCIKHLSHRDTTLATFSVAGVIKRSLGMIGADIQKTKGFGQKREMLTATFGQFAKKRPAPRPKTALIIGSGICGLMSAYWLARHGVQVTLLDKDAPLSGASGNLRALFCPKLSNIHQADTHLPTVSFLYAERLYRTFNQLAKTPILEQTGVVDFMLPTQKSADKLREIVSPYPDKLIHDYQNTAYDAPFLAFLPTAGLVNTHALAEFVLSLPNIHFQKAHLDKLDTTDNGVLAHSSNGTYQADVAVICAGFESHHLHPTVFETRKIRGQVSYITHSSLNKTNAQPANIAQQSIKQQFIKQYHPVVKYDGYACAFDDTLLFGASFVRNNTDTSVHDDDHRFNLDKLNHALPHALPNIDITHLQGRAGIRSQTPDYHPMVGQVDGNIYIHSAMGSKGYSFAPWCAKLLADSICKQIVACERSMLDKLSPHRPRLQTPIDQNR